MIIVSASQYIAIGAFSVIVKTLPMFVCSSKIIIIMKPGSGLPLHCIL